MIDEPSDKSLIQFFPDLDRRPQKLVDSEMVIRELESSNQFVRETAWRQTPLLLRNKWIDEDEVISRKKYLFDLLKGKHKWREYKQVMEIAKELFKIGLLTKEEYELL